MKNADRWVERYMPTVPIAWHHPALYLPCPHCKEPGGRLCVTRDGKKRRMHRVRVRAALLLTYQVLSFCRLRTEPEQQSLSLPQGYCDRCGATKILLPEESSS